MAVLAARVCRCGAQDTVAQRQRDFGHSHGHSRVTGICRLHGVHGQRTNRGGQVLAHLLGEFRRGGGNLIINGESRSLGEKNRNGGAVSKLAFIGLGVMGFPMAGHLVTKGGHEVTVYNRSRAKAEAWVGKHEGRLADTPAKAAEGAEIVFSCVGDDPDLREVTLGPNGAFQKMTKGAIFVDHTTASAKVARELATEAKKRGFDFLDAPVSGGQAGAENGQLTVMVGGNAAAFERAKPVVAHFAKAVTLTGGSGSGQLAKMVNQICIAGLVQGLSEGLNFAIRAGLDAKLVLDVISKGAAQSWQMENRGKTMVEDKFDFGFAVDWMRKDLRICSETAREIGAELPVTQTIAGFYDEVSKMGCGPYSVCSMKRSLRSPGGRCRLLIGTARTSTAVHAGGQRPRGQASAAENARVAGWWRIPGSRLR